VNLLKRVEPRHVGQADIQQHYIGMPTANGFEALPSGASRDDSQLVGAKRFVHGKGDIGLVVDDQ
jgi:hypothetical protein